MATLLALLGGGTMGKFCVESSGAPGGGGNFSLLAVRLLLKLFGWDVVFVIIRQDRGNSQNRPLLAIHVDFGKVMPVFRRS